MKKGAFALLDCLGFKGIWRREPEALIRKLKLISQTAETSAKKRIIPPVTPVRRKTAIQVKLLSDTIAISITGGPTIYDEISSMVFVIRDLMDLYLKETPHLLLRGCISYDEHITHRNFLVGPAVDATAENMNSAQGAFVWFLPPTAEMLKRLIAPYMAKKDILYKLHKGLFPRYAIPIKNGHYTDTYAVNPLFGKTKDEAFHITKLYETAMVGSTMDIWMKRQHTLEFLGQCNRDNSIFLETGGVEIVG